MYFGELLFYLLNFAYEQALCNGWGGKYPTIVLLYPLERMFLPEGMYPCLMVEIEDGTR